MNNYVVQRVTNPLLQTTTYSWQHGRLANAQDPRLAPLHLYLRHDADRWWNATAGVQNVTGRFTYLYNSSDQIRAIVDQHGIGPLSCGTVTASARPHPSAKAPTPASHLHVQRSRSDHQCQRSAGIATTYVYDSVGRRSGIVNPAGERTTSLYDVPESRRHPESAGHRTTLVRDIMNRVTAEIDADGYRTTYTYDPVGRPQSTIDPLLERTTQLYDAKRGCRPRSTPWASVQPMSTIQTTT